MTQANRADQAELDLKASRLSLRRLAKQWRESGDESDLRLGIELDKLLDGCGGLGETRSKP